MPEIITKYPDVVLTVLKSSGAKCGGEQKQKILTQCPPSQFCSFPGGEVCVYGLSQLSSMTQIKSIEIQEAMGGEVSMMWCGVALILLVFLFGLGLLVGAKLKK